MKKILALLLALLLTAAVTAGSGEEETAAPGMFDLYAMDGETPVWLGTAVSLYDGILMTADIVLPESLTHLVITDGRNVWDAEAAAPDRAGLAVTILYDTETQKPAAGIFELDSGAAKLTDCFVTTGDEKLSRVNRDDLRAEIIKYPHHGKTGLFEEFYQTVNPYLAIITNIKTDWAGVGYLSVKKVPYMFTCTIDAYLHLYTDGYTWFVERVPMQE